jgi:hypothetical protein
MPGSSSASCTGPTIAAPAPSPKMMAVDRSAGSTQADIFSAPTTRTCLALPARIASLALASP